MYEYVPQLQDEVLVSEPLCRRIILFANGVLETMGLFFAKSLENSVLDKKTSKNIKLIYSYFRLEDAEPFGGDLPLSPLYDRLYSTGRGGKMSGEPIVYGGLAFAWLCGLASRDVSENALWDLGYTEGYHTQPLFAGETIGAVSRVLAKNPPSPPFNKGGLEGFHAGIVSFQLIGVKGITASDAVEKYGPELFEKENDKQKSGKEKIPEKKSLRSNADCFSKCRLPLDSQWL